MLPAEDYRKNFLEGDLKRDEGLTTPEDVERVDDLSYGPYGDDNLFDIYYQKGTQGVQPAIISVHGGAWVAGTKATYQFYCMSLAQRGFTVVNFNYRRAPETQFPGALEDINRLLGWVLENGKEYHIDTENLFLAGDSAGAQMTSQYLAMLTNPEFKKLFSLTIPESLKIRACALNCGVYDAKGYLLTDENAPMHYYAGELTEEKLAALDTMRYVNGSFPPAYIVSATRDFLRANAVPMYEALQKLGVESKIQIFGTEDEPKGHVFHLDIRDEQAAVCNDNECEFFRQFIGK